MKIEKKRTEAVKDGEVITAQTTSRGLDIDKGKIELGGKDMIGA